MREETRTIEKEGKKMRRRRKNAKEIVRGCGRWTERQTESGKGYGIERESQSQTD